MVNGGSRNGRVGEGLAPPSLEIRNPATGEFVGTVPVATDEDIANAVGAARAAQPAWLDAGFRARARVVRRFQRLLHTERDRILDLIQDETGKARRDALGETVSLLATCGYYLQHGRSLLRSRQRPGALPLVTSAEVSYQPLGVVGFISPWNYPFLLAVDDAIPALLAGNAIVIKPSELTPHCAELAIDLLRRAGLPDDVARVVHGGGEVGAQLINHVDGLAFTGSADTGRKVAAAAGQRLIPCSLELGGKNPAIVLSEADVESAVAGLMPAVFFNSGQTCINVERIYVPRQRMDEFVTTARARAQSLKVAFSRDFEPDMGSLVSADHLAKVGGQVVEATSQGAEVIVGGARREDLGEAFYAPTLLSSVPASANLAGEETFGPVATVYAYDDLDEAVARANDTPYGLNASVWGPRRAARRVASRIQAGSVGVNSTLMIYNCLAAPMGGVKASGVGRRHAGHGITRFTQPRSIAVSFATAGGYDAVLGSVKTPRRARWASWILSLRRHLPRW